jgi:hypothetical protein
MGLEKEERCGWGTEGAGQSPAILAIRFMLCFRHDENRVAVDRFSCPLNVDGGYKNKVNF